MVPKEEREYYKFFGGREVCFFKFGKRASIKIWPLALFGGSSNSIMDYEFVHQSKCLTNDLSGFQDGHQILFSPWHGE